jgi:protease-4
MSFSKNVLSSFLGSTVALLVGGSLLIFIFVSALVGGLVAAFSDANDGSADLEMPVASVLRVAFDDVIVERGTQTPTLNLGDLSADMPMGLDQILSALKRAAEDDHIKGIALCVSSVAAAPSTLLDLRRGLEEFKASGKFIMAYAETMSLGALYLNSVADELYLHPNGGAELAGMSLETTYFTGMLEKVGVDITVVRGPDNEFKSAVEPFVRKEMSASNRLQMEELLSDIWDEVRSGIAEGRGLSEQEIDDMAENLLLRLPEDGVELGLFDGLLYADEFDAAVEEALGEEPEYASIGEYALPERFLGKSFEQLEDLAAMFEGIEKGTDLDESTLGAPVAVIYAVGGIESGEGDEETIGSETLAEAIRSARMATDVKAVVLRVNSPGGSALASDVIWRETKLLKEAGKKLVVSMGDYAASGGYYISANADRIYANATTITGSIGVFGMIPNAKELLEDKMGLAYDEVSTHAHAGMGLNAALDAVQLEAINEGVTDIYNDFVQLVAEGRSLSVEQVDEIARGRVWSGLDAQAVGLVDEIGNLEDAIAFAESFAGLEAGSDRVYLPEHGDPFEAFIEDLMGVELALGKLGFSSEEVKEFRSVARMVRGGDRIQARLPFSIQVR